MCRFGRALSSHYLKRALHVYLNRVMGVQFLVRFLRVRYLYHAVDFMHGAPGSPSAGHSGLYSLYAQFAPSLDLDGLDV